MASGRVSPSYPVFHQVCSGSWPSPIEFTSAVDEPLERYGAPIGECRDVTFILNKGNDSKENIAGLLDVTSSKESLVSSHYSSVLTNA